MGYSKDVKELLDTIPKHHHKEVKKLMKLFYINGVEDCKAIITSIDDIPPLKMKEYGVFHEDEIDGG